MFRHSSHLPLMSDRTLHGSWFGASTLPPLFMLVLCSSPLVCQIILSLHSAVTLRLLLLEPRRPTVSTGSSFQLMFTVSDWALWRLTLTDPKLHWPVISVDDLCQDECVQNKSNRRTLIIFCSSFKAFPVVIIMVMPVLAKINKTCVVF